MKNVTKKDLVEKISQKTGLSQIHTRAVLMGLIDEISKSLVQGNNIEIRGFGRFKIKERNARIARNPRTGEAVQVEKGIKPKFEASRELSKRVNLFIKNRTYQPI